MNFELSSDQQLLIDSVEAMIAPYARLPSGAHAYVEYGAALQRQLEESAFLTIATQPSFGLLEAALVVELVARCPLSVEAASSALILPLIEGFSGPVALAWHVNRPSRFLNYAKTLCYFEDDAVYVGRPDPDNFAAIDSVAAYPLAILASVPQGAVCLTGDRAAAISRRAAVAIAAEAAGLMRGALDLTVQYVKDRRQFGQPLGHFQAIQHRLAEDAQLVHACRNLVLRAADEDEPRAATLACLYAQDAMRKIIYDCHQFSGAMGLTLEYPLHLWTYRLKYLQGEAGGRARQRRVLADLLWPPSRVA